MQKLYKFSKYLHFLIVVFIFFNTTIAESRDLNGPIKKPEKYNIDNEKKLPIIKDNNIRILNEFSIEDYNNYINNIGIYSIHNSENANKFNLNNINIYSKIVTEKTFNWLYLRSEKSNPLINEMIYFIENNPDWPDINKIQIKIEKKIFTKKPSKEFTINYFKKFPPISSYGHIMLSVAHFDQGNYRLGKELYKHAWHKMKMSEEVEDFFLKYCNICINDEDLVFRFDRMYYLNQKDDLLRVANKLNSDYILIGNFLNKVTNNEILNNRHLNEISKKFNNNSTFLVGKIKYLIQNNNYEDASKLLLTSMNSDIVIKNPVLWGVQQELIAKKFISQDRYTEAYIILNLHQLSSGQIYDSIEFLSGWLALKKLKKTKASLSHFQNLNNNTQDDSTLAKSEYWLGMAYKELQINENYNKHIKNSSAYPFTFYGQLSINLLNQKNPYENYRKKINDGLSNNITIEKNELFIVAKLLAAANKPYMGSKFLYKLSELSENPNEKDALSRYANIVNLPQTSIRIAKKQDIYSNSNLINLYPINDFPKLVENSNNKDGDAIVYSIIRQESEFESKAISYSGAIGLMQIMPSTGKMLAKQEKIEYSQNKLQEDPFYNVQLGSRYISDLIKQFDGSYILAISSYNAGPNRVKKWIKTNGDPREEKIDNIDWIEMIPYKETRSYVKKVLSNMQIYRILLNPEISDIRLIDDLKKSSI